MVLLVLCCSGAARVTMLCGPRTPWSQGELVGKAPLSHRLAQLDKRFVQPLKQVHLITHALACSVFLLMVASALVCSFTAIHSPYTLLPGPLVPSVQRCRQQLPLPVATQSTSVVVL